MADTDAIDALDPNDLTDDADWVFVDNCLGNVSGGSMSADVFNLTEQTTYYYRAFVAEYNQSTSSYEYRYGDRRSFTTASIAAFTPTGWLELPQVTGSEDLVLTMYTTGGTSGTEENRNYSFNYSKNYYSALWTAYTIKESDTVGSASTSSWSYNNAVFSGNYQVNVKSNSYGTNYGNNLYSRGHQIPNAHRLSNATANAQTYYLSNQTPQIQDKFNASIWGALEKAERGFVTTNSANTSNYNGSFSTTDVLYVITGPCYGKAGTSETPTVVLNATSESIKPATVQVPLYYWKVLLKVKWNAAGTAIERACAIGFWFIHQEYNNSSYTDATFVKSVNQIETWTGFNLFANLPDTIEESVESNSSWEAFRDF